MCEAILLYVKTLNLKETRAHITEEKSIVWLAKKKFAENVFVSLTKRFVGTTKNSISKYSLINELKIYCEKVALAAELEERLRGKREIQVRLLG